MVSGLADKVSHRGTIGVLFSYNDPKEDTSTIAKLLLQSTGNELFVDSLKIQLILELQFVFSSLKGNRDIVLIQTSNILETIL